jgi:hypothetical protein
MALPSKGMITVRPHNILQCGFFLEQPHLSHKNCSDCWVFNCADRIRVPSTPYPKSLLTVQSILCSGYGILADLLYSADMKLWVKFIRWVFTMYPPFNLAKMYADVATLSSNTVDFAQGQIVRGQGH